MLAVIHIAEAIFCISWTFFKDGGIMTLVLCVAVVLMGSGLYNSVKSLSAK